MKLISWNVNGLRAVLKKNFVEFVEEHSPDILCLQETKARAEQVPLEGWSEGYHLYWSSAKKSGYSGTMIATRTEPLSVRYGVGMEELDHEGRVIALEFEGYWVVTVYTPNAQNELQRLDYRHKQWDPAFLAYVKELEKSKPVVFCGDLNVAHKEIDLARPKANVGNPGFTPEEREGFDNIVAGGFLDSFRELYPDTPEKYSWWSYRAGARKRNVGWRIDYVCLSSQLRDRLDDAFILSEVLGSDHCPVGVVLS